MTLNYELTFEDFREAHGHHRQYLYKRSRRRVRLLPTFNELWITILFGIAAFLLFRTMVALEPPDRAGIRDSTAAAVFDLLLPLIAVAGIFLPVMAMAVLTKAERWRRLGLVVLPVVMFALMLPPLIIARHVRAAARPPLPPRPPVLWQSILVPHLPWIAYLVATAIFIGIVQRIKLRTSWDAQPNLHLAHILDATVQGLTISTATSTHHVHWHGITTFLETPNLFLLFLSDEEYRIVPKRALATAEDQDAFRQMVRTLTADVRAFPVIAAPLPGKARN